MELDIREVVAEKSFDTCAVRAPGLREYDHFVFCDRVLRKIGFKHMDYVSYR